MRHLISIVATAACALLASATTLPATPEHLPQFRWDHKPDAPTWTDATLAALETHGAALAQTVPADIADWCPAYAKADAQQRRLFWVGLLSTLSKHESTYRQSAVGGDGKWFGLVQIAPATARSYGCAARSGDALKDGAANLRCAVRILAVTVPRDQVVSQGMRGVAADWGPFHQRRKREDMRAWLSQQPYCAADTQFSDNRPQPRKGAQRLARNP